MPTILLLKQVFLKNASILAERHPESQRGALPLYLEWLGRLEFGAVALLVPDLAREAELWQRSGSGSILFPGGSGGKARGSSTPPRKCVAESTPSRASWRPGRTGSGLV